MIKKHLLLIISLLPLAALNAQQEPHNTQFMYFKMGYNPGYAGSGETPCLTAIHRSQWTGLEGAPTTQVLTFDMPLLYRRIGIGFNLTRHSFGITERYTFEGAYAYRIPMGQGALAIGLQASVRNVNVDYGDERLKGTVPVTADGAIPVGMQSKFLPNFGAGVYYHTRQFYFGFSVPRLIENNLDYDEVGQLLSEEVRHIYLMSGVRVPLGEKVAFQPQALFKYAPNTPFDADINMSLWFVKKLLTGVTYRLGGSSESGFGESIDFLVGVQVSGNVHFGFSYDLTLSEIKDYNNGSFEGLVRVCFGKAEGEEVINPRFF